MAAVVIYQYCYAYVRILLAEAIAKTFPELVVQSPQLDIDPKETEQGCFSQYTNASTVRSTNLEKQKLVKSEQKRVFKELLDGAREMKSAIYGEVNAEKVGKWLEDLYTPMQPKVNSGLDVSEVNVVLSSLRHDHFARISSVLRGLLLVFTLLFIPFHCHLLAECDVRNDGIQESNNWVIGSSGTSTGMPLLANDPHLVMTAPSIWMLVHVVGSCGPRSQCLPLLSNVFLSLYLGRSASHAD